MRLHLAAAAVALAAAALPAALPASPAAPAAQPWQRAWVTGYSTREWLTGCYATLGRPGQHHACRTACGQLLDDRQLWVAANPRHGLGCGQRIQVRAGGRTVVATVMDRTASHFDFEFTVALACRTGARCAYPAFADPRAVSWRRVYR